MLQTDAVEVLGESGKDRLRSFIERIERLTEEKKALMEDIKEVFAEAKGTGFDTKIMKVIIKLRAMDSNEIQEQDAMVDLYRAALGLTSDSVPGSDDE
jgi:uncharacterized protein (UPF0335 family)